MMNLNGSHQYQMASQGEEFWTLKDICNVTLGDSSIDNPFSTELKRSREWFPEAAESDLFPRKKQAIESAGIVNVFSNELSWENEYMNWLFGSEKNTTLVTANDPQFENVNSSAGSSISYENRAAQTDQNGLQKPAVEVKHDFGTSKGISDDKRVSNGKSFSKYQEIMEALARPVSSYSLLYEQPLEKKGVVVKASMAGKNKLEKKVKVPANNFPTNVKSLTTTGMLDDVPVRYVSGSRELPAIIKGPAYLCGCQYCNYSKAFNAYELEQHAGCKTSHPNNHIRFQNGKSIHQVVQELKATPQHMLCDAIQTVTGSPINQKAFLLWKESFQGATRKIQHICAKEDTNLLELNPK